MFKSVINDIKMSKVTYLIENIKLKNLDGKIKAFKKLDKMKISKEIGLELLDASTYNYGIKDGNGGISASLISLCMKNYYKEYSDKIKKIFPLLDGDCQSKVVFLLSSIDNEYALDLYADLILKYYKESKFIPISNLYERIDSYKILFPKLYKALKFKYARNNILILVNDYLNAGVIPDVDIKKNKKILQDSISKIFNEALKMKFSNTSKAMQDDSYVDLRFFLERAINIEYYVSNKTTSSLLTKLFNGKDNQLKLFILENYIKKGKNIDKLNLDTIAKDNASRYPLYDLLCLYNKEKLMPKSYATGEKIALSDLYINFVLVNSYKELPKNMKFIKKKIINSRLYYVFEFKYSYLNNISFDTTTNYLIESSGLDKYNGKKITSKFIGLSGGYNSKEIPSLVETNNNSILWKKIGEKEKIDDVIDELVPDLTKVKIVEKTRKEKKEEKKNKKNLKRLEETIEKEEKKQEEKREQQKKEEVIDAIEEKVPKHKRFRFKFGYILFLLLIIFAGTLVTFTVYLKNPDLIEKETSTGMKVTHTKLSKIESTDKFKEINGQDIFKQQESSYYILFYKKNSDEKNSYYTFVNKLINANYIIYYVNLRDEKNKFLYKQNDLNFTVQSDRYLKVQDGDFEFYVDGKANILEEMEKEVIKIQKEQSTNNK